jgi:hypothetical protein
MQQTIPSANKFASGLAPDPQRIMQTSGSEGSDRNRLEPDRLSLGCAGLNNSVRHYIRIEQSPQMPFD